MRRIGLAVIVAVGLTLAPLSLKRSNQPWATAAHPST
jgi:hypothetical protein